MNDSSAEPTGGTSASNLWDLRKSTPRRSLLLCAVGATLGLLIAGFGLFTAHGTRTRGVPPEDAAMVNGVPLLRADLIQQFGALYGVPWLQATVEQKRKVLEDMIREEVYVQRGVEMGLANDEIEVRAALVQAAESQVAQDALITVPAEEDLQRWYASHLAMYAGEGAMALREWLLPRDFAGADQIVAALRAGNTPDALQLKSSGRLNDGREFYFAAEIHLGPVVFAVAKSMNDGEISAPIRDSDGMHILYMIANQRPVQTVYASARDQVLRDFLADKVVHLQAENERFLRKRADIKIAADLQ